ncbi:hypothetical protein KJE20_03456 [Pyrenophora tritici-repentis]|uniref:Uncharacterized protein n=1 Tax=Pyrenophora tritici-repentis TaxID=45151 RepID=A0A922N2A8_9PLEO|nr:hypothetical protein Ptr86124_012852 [Pyrenophora tritici-repentis]KAI1690278.1 hypothetical protein KJE20_03456 [Pyrenophora tritici-repentis]
MAFNSVAQVLRPINVVVWGEEAMGFLGAVTLLNSCMLVPSDSEYDLAAQKLVEAGFRPAPWTYAITDPQLVRDDEIGRRTLLRGDDGYGNLDANSLRFQFPAGFSGSERVVLLRSTYVGIRPPSDPESMQRFSCNDNLYYPDAVLLLESFIKTLLQEIPGSWRHLLQAWAIAYIYGNNNASFNNDPADFIQALHSSPTSNLSSVLGNIIAITNGLIQQIAAGQHNLDTANLAAQTLSHDPEKFTSTESNATKRQQNYLTFANKIKANFRNDRAYFTSEFMKIHYICGLLDSVAYTAIQEEILTIDDADDDANWAWKDSEELFKALDKLHALGDLSRNTRIELDKLNMGNTNFPNFLATFNRYANSSRRSATKKVDLLKLKVTPELLDRALTRKGSLAVDDFLGWCALF